MRPDAPSVNRSVGPKVALKDGTDQARLLMVKVQARTGGLIGDGACEIHPLYNSASTERTRVRAGAPTRRPTGRPIGILRHITSHHGFERGTHMSVARTHPFTNHHGFEERIGGLAINRFNIVFVSICELTSNGTPFQGLASMEVHNVVPHDGFLIVRGYIGWDSDVRAQLSIYAP
jgi:hypothetical protein